METVVVDARENSVLIESDWNLKEEPFLHMVSATLWPIRINRIRLEFKGTWTESMSIRS